METKLIAVINDESEIIVKEGKAVEGVGIFDGLGNSYNAGISNDLTVYGCSVDSDNSIFASDGTKIQGFLCSEKCVAVVVYDYYADNEKRIEGVFDSYEGAKSYVGNASYYNIKLIPLNRLNSAGW